MGVAKGGLLGWVPSVPSILHANSCPRSFSHAAILQLAAHTRKAQRP